MRSQEVEYSFEEWEMIVVLVCLVGGAYALLRIYGWLCLRWNLRTPGKLDLSFLGCLAPLAIVPLDYPRFSRPPGELVSIE
jgi:hypothetical protein